jgi:hypothetical protein
MDVVSTITDSLTNGSLGFKLAAATAAVVLSAKLLATAKAYANKWQLKGTSLNHFISKNCRFNRFYRR